MATQKATRRRFLVATITYSGLISTGVGSSLLRAGHAWAQSSDGNIDVLARMARLLFPHESIADEVYAEVVDSILTAAAADSSLSESLEDAVTALNAAQLRMDVLPSVRLDSHERTPAVGGNSCVSATGVGSARSQITSKHVKAFIKVSF